MIQRFFDRYPRFYETTATRRLENRLQQRWKMIVQRNTPLLKGARVLDLASHDGRWAFAALKAGAAYVEGVEARPELVASSNENFAAYGVSSASYAFHTDDVVRYLTANETRFDVILNLGFFYHTLKHLQILERMAAFGARTFIIDTGISSSASCVIDLAWDESADPRNAVDHLQRNRAAVPVGTLSRPALQMLLQYVGYDCAELSWHDEIGDFDECDDYRTGRRATFLANAL